jgi:uncharacterized repeat protein (TIGR02543 family)
MRFGAATLVLIMALGLSLQEEQDAQALPAAGQCSKSTGEWICNVENQNLNFYKTATIEQTTAVGDQTIGDNVVTGSTIRYLDVYINGTTRIDADITITEVNGLPELDLGSSTASFGKDVIGVNLRTTEVLSFTVDFINAATDEPVTMLNIDLLVQDLDTREHVQFQGLSSYTLATTNTLSVTPSTAPNPETGQRDVTGKIGNSDFTNSSAAISVKFASASSLRLRTYVDSGGSGSYGLILKFGPTTTFWGSTSTTSTAVGFGNYTVTYDANDGAGTTPAAVTAAGTQTLSNGEGLLKSSIPISSWNTRADGTGQTLALGASFLPSGDTTLYAQYSAQTVTFDSNQGTGTMPNQINAGPANLSANTFSRSGYSFAGWNTSSDGTGASFANSSPYPFSISETLYAQWTANSNAVSYDEAGGSSVADGSFLTGGSVTLPSAPSRDGYTFSGWFRAASGGSALTSPYSPPDTSAITLFAQWTQNPADSHTVTFNANGGAGTMSNQTASSLTALTGNGFDRPGYSFAGWSTSSDGSVEYLDGASFPFSASETLFAQWTLNAAESTPEPTPAPTTPEPTPAPTTPEPTPAPTTPEPTPAPTTPEPTPSPTTPEPTPSPTTPEPTPAPTTPTPETTAAALAPEPNTPSPEATETASTLTSAGVNLEWLAVPGFMLAITGLGLVLARRRKRAA